jgi:hypothetical protein
MILNLNFFLRLAAGVILLLAGRKVYWLFVAFVGFFTGLALATLIVPKQPQSLHLIIGLLGGVVGAALAVSLQKAALGLAGLIVGGYFVFHLQTLLGLKTGGLTWPLVIIGGILGAVLAVTLFDWGLIFLSSMTGVVLITQVVNPGPQLMALMFVVLLIIGIGLQTVVKLQEHSDTI